MSHSCTDDDNFRNYHVEEKRQGRFEERVMDSELAKAMSLFVLSKVILIICITGIFKMPLMLTPLLHINFVYLELDSHF